ncbi:aminoacyl-tRNA hydrolase [Paratractidigestivibacter faecalis]|uniref:Peptidyl-tRNA hydrolase n=1 Tax=Paratractidigestivibacter faecalis TaxID=2292441 RepID=A0ABV1IG28_9ACTN
MAKASAAPATIAIVCGLGNPDADYERTRHNAGFATVDVLAARHGVRYWKSEAGAQVASLTWRGADGEQREVLLAKPMSYMNTSGGPLSKLARAHRVTPQQILVVHDEVDLAAGEVRLKLGGGLNAHNGLRSIADKLGSRDFARVQFGIGRPPGKMQVADYVLRELKGGFLDEFNITAERAADLVERILTEGAK